MVPQPQLTMTVASFLLLVLAYILLMARRSIIHWLQMHSTPRIETYQVNNCYGRKEIKTEAWGARQPKKSS